MAYATVQDLASAYGEIELARLTTPEGGDLTASVAVTKATTAIGVASDLIDSYLRRRYGVPLAVTPPSVNRACLVLARYDLSFGGAVQPSEETRLARRETMQWLRDLNEGRASLEGVELASQVVGARTSDRSQRVGPGCPFRLPGSGLGLGW